MSRAARYSLVLSIILFGVTRSLYAQARDKCPEERATAEDHYLEGRFAEAVVLLRQCLERETLFAGEAVQVYRLMGLAFLNQEDPDTARKAIQDLLDIVPEYEADPIQDPPSYTMLVRVLRQERAAQAVPEDAPVAAAEQPRPEAVVVPPPRVVPGPSNQRRRLLDTPKSWLLATGGAAVIVTAVAMAFGGGSSSQQP